MTDGAADPADEPHATLRVTMEVIDGRLIAVKRAELDDPEAVERLRREAVVLAATTHPNVVELIGTVEDDDAVELRLGAAGRHNLATVPPRTPTALAATARDILTLVEELHAVGVTHGSVGADHVVVGPSGRLTLVSFGRATPPEGPIAEHDAGVRRDLAAIGSTISHLVFLLPDDLDRTDRRMADKLLGIAARLRDQPTPTVARRVHNELDRLSGGTPRESPLIEKARRNGRSDRQPATEGQPRLVPPADPDPTEDRGGAARMAAFGVVALVGLWLLAGPPSLPPLPRGDTTDGLITAVVEMIRITAMVGAGYLIAIGAAGVAARRTGSTRLGHVVDAATPRWLRRTAVGLAGAGVLTSLAPTPSPTPSAREAAPTTGSHVAHPPRASSTVPTTTTTTTSPSAPAPAPAPAPSTEPDSGTPPVRDADPPSVEEVEPQPAADERLPDLVVVAGGDHLWSIAATSLEQHLGRVPSAVEVHPHWRAVIELNRDVLVDPENPDLLYRGQVLELPPFGSETA